MRLRHFRGSPPTCKIAALTIIHSVTALPPTPRPPALMLTRPALVITGPAVVGASVSAGLVDATDRGDVLADTGLSLISSTEAIAGDESSAGVSP